MNTLNINRISFPILILLCLALLSGCGAVAAPTETDWTPYEIAAAIAESQRDLPEMQLSLPGDSLYEAALTELYGFSEGEVADGAVYSAEGLSACEIAVLRLREGGDADEARRLLKSYADRRRVDFTGYFPEAAAMAENARVLTRGRWAALLICPEPEAAEAAFSACFTHAAPGLTPPPRPTALPEETPAPEITDSPEPTPEPTPEPWSYDHDRLVRAWETGDRSGLPEMDRSILRVVDELLAEVTRPNQSLPELELAIHDWMVEHMDYDTGHIERFGGTALPNDDNPYGALVGGLAICEGYTRSFQLLMDLVGIECISVFGHSDNGEEYGEHAWNQVRFDGDWYIVDVTWDDPLSNGPLPAKYHHTYFNVTADSIRRNHFWDEENVPEARGTVYTWAALRKN